MRMTKKVLCLDWDKRSLRIVVARQARGGKTVLEDAHSHRLPNTVDADDPQSLGEFIKQMLKRHRLGHRRVVVDVPRERAVINRLTLPPTPTDDVAAAVRFQAMKELPFAVETAAIDYVVVERGEQGLVTEVLLAAVTKDTLEKVRQTCEAAGLAPARIGLRPYANLVSTQHVTDLSGRRVVFVDVGPGATEIDVMQSDGLGFARSANVNVPLPLPRAEAGEDSQVISISDVGDMDASDEAIEAAGEELVVEVMRTLQAYRATAAEGPIDEVIVAGGTGIESQFADRLQRRLGYPVTLYDPTQPLGIDSSEAPKLRSFSAALGLAWGLNREGALALDFLNPKRPVSQREVRQRRTRLIGGAAAAALIVLIGGLTWQYRQRAQLRDQLTESNDKLWEQVKEQIEVLNRVDEVKEWTAEAIWPEELLTVTQLALAAGAEPGKRLLVREIELDAASRRPAIILRDAFVSNFEVSDSLLRKIAEYEVSDETPYEVRPVQLNPVPDGLKFTRNMDVRIELAELREFREDAGQREKARKKRLREP